MRIRANRSNLKKYGSELIGNCRTSLELDKDIKELIKVCLNGFERTYGHISHDQAKHLEKIDKILGNHGVEGILESNIDILYSNTGDTYALTILYYRNKLWIGDWGSIVEGESL